MEKKVMIVPSYEHSLGRIEGKLEAIHEDVCEIKTDINEIRGRVRNLETKSLVMGSIGAGVTILATKLKMLLGTFR